MIVEFDTYPIGKESGLSEDIAEVEKIIESSGLEHQLTAMGTIIEGDWDEVMKVIKKCHHHLREDYDRVETHIKIDDHAGRAGRIEGKVEGVKNNL
ncbi:MAG: MTH1187 family thiamine-binding protein [Candidatus Bipolaricaulota bacterium]|nr:MTH1187 family thiamine-binding protein [Candidatus Bipolaricaulota bacterium]